MIRCHKRVISTTTQHHPVEHVAELEFNLRSARQPTAQPLEPARSNPDFQRWDAMLCAAPVSLYREIGDAERTRLKAALGATAPQCIDSGNDLVAGGCRRRRDHGPARRARRAARPHPAPQRDGAGRFDVHRRRPPPRRTALDRRQRDHRQGLYQSPRCAKPARSFGRTSLSRAGATGNPYRQRRDWLIPVRWTTWLGLDYACAAADGGDP